MCQPFPTPAAVTSGAKFARSPWARAAAWIVWRASNWLSAAATGSVAVRLSSTCDSAYSAWSWPISAAGAQVAQQLGGELIDGEERVRAVSRPLMGGLDIVRVATDEELNLVSGANLEPYLGGTPHLKLQGRALVVGPHRAVSRELASGRPGKRGLAGERSQTVEHRHQPDVAGWGGESFVTVRDPVVRVEHREQRGHADASPRRLREPINRHRARPGDPVVVRPGDRHARHPGASQPVRQESGSTGLELRSLMWRTLSRTI